MKLSEQIGDMLGRVSLSTAKTVGPEWDALRVAIVANVASLEDRVAKLEKRTPAPAKRTAKRK